MKNKIRNLVQATRLSDHLPHGSISQISEKLNKERGTVRGALNGKWVNTDVIDVGLELIEEEIERLSKFLEVFKEEYNKIK